MNLTLTDINRPFDYAQVIAQIINQEKVDYLSYDIYDLSRHMRRNDSTPSTQGTSPASQKGSSKTFVVVSIVTGSLLLIVIIILVVIILWNKKKYENLDQTVNKISFAGDDKDKDTGDNLLYGQERK